MGDHMKSVKLTMVSLLTYHMKIFHIIATKTKTFWIHNSVVDSKFQVQNKGTGLF